MNTHNLLVITAVAAAVSLAACEPKAGDSTRINPATAVASDAAQPRQTQTAGEAVERARQAPEGDEIDKTDEIVRQADARIKAADARLKEIRNKVKSQAAE